MPNSVVTETPDTQDVKHPLLTVHEVAQILRVDDTTVRRWVKNGVLEAVSLPHQNTRQAYRIKRDTVEKLFNQVTVQSNQAPVHSHEHAHRNHHEHTNHEHTEHTQHTHEE